jgi:hypothetical protein
MVHGDVGFWDGGGDHGGHRGARGETIRAAAKGRTIPMPPGRITRSWAALGVRSECKLRVGNTRKGPVYSVQFTAHLDCAL